MGIALVAHDDSPFYPTDVLIGSVAFFKVLRVNWGVVGIQCARFGSFFLGPRPCSVICGASFSEQAIASADTTLARYMRLLDAAPIHRTRS
jgi:hypothetical protein